MAQKAEKVDVSVLVLNETVETIKQIAREQKEELAQIVAACLTTYVKRGRFFFCGNGGSAANATHFAADFTKRPIWSIDGAQPVQAIALTANIDAITMWGNDSGYDQIFQKQLETFELTENDTVIAFSGSGNSPNVLNAVAFAKERGATTIGFTSFGGGKLAPLVDFGIVVPQKHLQKLGTDFHGAVMGEYEAISDVVMHAVIESFRMEVQAHVRGDLQLPNA